MPRIDDAFLDCSIYLYHSQADAERGSIHSNGGSGFVVGVPSAFPNRVFTYAISNRHVVEASPVIRLNTKSGVLDIFDFKTTHWTFSDDQDIAVCPISFSDAHKFRYVPRGAFLTRERIEQERIGPGDDVFMVGRFVNHEGQQRNTPSVRFGNLAMMPDEPVRHNFNSSKGQLSFLVDIRTVGGYSGSPVFVCGRTFSKANGGWSLSPPNGPWLLGVEWGHLLDHNGINTGMSGVVPAWCLDELLNAPHLAKQRDDADEVCRRQQVALGTMTD